MSNVKPPRPRCNCSDDGDIFRSASTFNTLQPSGLPKPENQSCSVAEESNGCSLNGDQNSCSLNASNSDTVVRDFDSHDNGNDSTCNNTHITPTTSPSASPEASQCCETPEKVPMPSCSTPRSPSPKQPKSKSNLGACHKRLVNRTNTADCYIIDCLPHLKGQISGTKVEQTHMSTVTG